MSQFVNYKKRSVQLPAGCKNLSDLFKPATMRKPTKGVVPLEFTVLRQGFVTKTLANIEEQVAMIFDSLAFGCDLDFSSADQQLSLCVKRMKNDINSAVNFLHDQKREEAMRGFFDRHGLAATPTEATTIFDLPFPDLPFWRSFLILPMPLEARAFSKIASDLFREFCGMNDQSQLQCFLLEYEMAK